MLMNSINEISIDTKARKQHAARRGLTSQVGERLRLSYKQAKGEVKYQQNIHSRIMKIEDSIFVDTKETRNTDRTLNQYMSSNQNPLGRERSPTFGGPQERSTSANGVKYTYV